VLAILGVASALGSSPLKRTAPPAAAQSPAAAQPPAESTNLLQNADLSLGGGNSPEHWRSEGWVDKPEATTYDWIHPAGGAAGELEVDNLQPNDARWMQSLALGAGWHHFSVEARTEKVGEKETGASISVMEDGIMSVELKGDTSWRRLDLYLKVGKDGADVDVALRVGGYASLNTGRAFFRHPSMTKVAGPPAHAERVYDLDAVRKESAAPPIGRPWTLVAAFILLGAGVAIGWRVFGETGPEVATIPVKPKTAIPETAQKPARPAAGKKSTRKKARR